MCGSGGGDEEPEELLQEGVGGGDVAPVAVGGKGGDEADDALGGEDAAGGVEERG